MSLRIVAADTPKACRSTIALLPTGSRVSTKSCTIARSTCRPRSVTISPPHALQPTGTRMI